MAAQAIQLHVERPPFRVGNCCLVSIAKIRERLSRPVRRRATELAAGKGRALSEAVGRVAQPPPEASSAGDPAGAPNRARLFFGYSSFGEAKESNPRVRRGTQRSLNSLRPKTQTGNHAPAVLETTAPRSNNDAALRHAMAGRPVPLALQAGCQASGGALPDTVPIAPPRGERYHSRLPGKRASPFHLS